MGAESGSSVVLVVGAGPAGSAAAFHLARRGVDVLLVDRASFPRDKVCGDGLTPRAVGALLRMGVEVAAPGFLTVGRVRTYGFDGSVEFAWPSGGPFPPLGAVRRRRDLDRLLADRAVEAGATFLDGTLVEGPILEDGRVRGAHLRPPGGGSRPVRAAFVVAADGPSSRFATQAGVRRDPSAPVAAAARTYIQSSRDLRGTMEAFLTLRDGRRHLPGYGWIFPAEEGHLNVGVYVVRSPGDPRSESLHEAFDAFMRSLPPEWKPSMGAATEPLRSAPIPMGLNRTALVRPGLLVAGDAAGLVNPFTGEGIGYALESGELAASAIFAALASNDPAAIRRYSEVVRARYGRMFVTGRRFARAISHSTVMRLGVTVGMQRRKLAAGALLLMADVGHTPSGWRERAAAAMFRLTPSAALR